VDACGLVCVNVYTRGDAMGMLYVYCNRFVMTRFYSSERDKRQVIERERERERVSECLCVHRV